MTADKMIPSTFLDILFDGRNKKYGAYELRKNYDHRLGLALLGSVGLTLLLMLLYQRLIPEAVKDKLEILKTETEKIIVFENFRLPEPPSPSAGSSAPQATEVLPTRVVENAREPERHRMTTINPVPTLPIADTYGDGGSADGKIPSGAATLKPLPSIPTLTPASNEFVEEMATFPGGDEAMHRFIRERIQYPEKAKLYGILGTVEVQFIVGANGEVHDCKILKGIGGGCDEEVLRVISMMPVWHPGKTGGHPVPVMVRMPIKFALRI